MILVTGAAGFIGFHVARRLLAAGADVVGFDNLNAYYDPRLKHARLAELSRMPGWRFVRGDLADGAALARLVADEQPACVVHLAAQAGVRWSIDNPAAYVSSNLVGFANVLEACRHAATPHLVYASSSSVYGANTKTPFAETDPVDRPVSLYAATKKANELMAHSYAHLFGLPCTGLRFFTVYGPWGRPDMAYWKFTEAILAGTPIEVFGGGLLRRDFTFVDDVVEAIVRMIDAPPSAGVADDGSAAAPCRVYNVGNHTPVTVARLLAILERLCGRPAIRLQRPRPPGDVEATFADVSALARDFGFEPRTTLDEGLTRFVDWYREWRQVTAVGKAA
ncbi:MAG: NAD-dependent epimerase/dehydratase family protein [Planctomycetaceae bacterium]